MRGITPPSPRPHRCCRQSQQIQSLAFANLTRRNEHSRQHQWSIATSYDLFLPYRQRRHLPPPPLDDNQDDVDDEDDDSNYYDDNDNDDDGDDDCDDNDNSSDDDDDDDDESNYNLYYGLHDYDSDGYCLYNYDDLDNNIDDNNNHDDDSDDEDSNNPDDHSYNDNDENSDDEDLDEEDSDDKDGEDDKDDDLSHYDAASDLECIRTQLSIVQRLIDVLGPDFQSLTHYPPIPTIVTSLPFLTAFSLVRLFVDYALSMFQRITY